MQDLYRFLTTMALVAVFGAALRQVWGKRPSASTENQQVTDEGIFNATLYLLFAAILVSTPAASFIIAAKWRVRPSALGIFFLMGVGVLTSLSVTLAVARLAGRDRLESYWRYLETRSRVSRKAIVKLWIGLVVSLLSVAAVILMTTQ
jgi:hypothetical protein